MAFDLVIFDCDGVLVDSERLVNAIESRLLARIGLQVSADEARARFKGRTLGEVALIAEAMIGEPLPVEWIYDWGMETALGFLRDLRAIDGVHRVLDGLARAGIRTCVASQSPRARVELCLALAGLSDHFGDRVYTASMVPRAKPSPDLFLLAA